MTRTTPEYPATTGHFNLISNIRCGNPSRQVKTKEIFPRWPSSLKDRTLEKTERPSQNSPRTHLWTHSGLIGEMDMANTAEDRGPHRSQHHQKRRISTTSLEMHLPAGLKQLRNASQDQEQSQDRSGKQTSKKEHKSQSCSLSMPRVHLILFNATPDLPRGLTVRFPISPLQITTCPLTRTRGVSLPVLIWSLCFGCRLRLRRSWLLICWGRVLNVWWVESRYLDNLIYGGW